MESDRGSPTRGFFARLAKCWFLLVCFGALAVAVAAALSRHNWSAFVVLGWPCFMTAALFWCEWADAGRPDDDPEFVSDRWHGRR